MEHSMDVSWMTHGKGRPSRPSCTLPPWILCLKLGKHTNSDTRNNLPSSHQPAPSNQPPPESTSHNGPSNGHASAPAPASSSVAPALVAATSAQLPEAGKPIPQRPGRGRSQSNESNGTPPRRGSWFSNISSKLSGSPAAAQPAFPGPAPVTDDADDVAPLPKITPNKNAVLPHASRQTGDAPYIPAPPKSNQPGFFGVFRRLSSSGATVTQGSRASHGLVERRVLNVDQKRERCCVQELTQAKLRRVAFCVDVEIAPMPKYVDEEEIDVKPADKTQKRKMTERSEGLALKHPQAVEEQKEAAGVVKETGEALPKEPVEDGSSQSANGHTTTVGDAPPTDQPKSEKEPSRKKEKKKRSEAERKAKKERKRKEALEKGAIPMEIHLDSDSSTEDSSVPPGTPRVQATPTTSPARIYRRCCQLRETDILTKVTHQLPKTTETCADGIVESLDLTGYYLPLPDLVTLGDFLAVVPIKEVILEDCGLADEGLRVVLAGLLAARKPEVKQRKTTTRPADLVPQGGVVQRLVLKNNKIGSEGWKHICLFIHMCRSLKCLDLSNLPFPAATPEQPTRPSLNSHPHTGNSTANMPGPADLALLLSKSIAQRLAGSELELLNLGGTGLSSIQLGAVIDGMLESGVTRLGLSHNNLDDIGVDHVARYLRDAKCEGIDLGGNDLRGRLGVIADAIGEKDQLWAISLANCNLKPASLCKLFPRLAKLPNFKFLDLSHNHDLFESTPSALGLLRRYLPKLENLKRFHLADVSMSSEQAIALAEILPEVKTLAHINILENPSLVSLADARTEDSQEEACALYASLLAAARVSKTLVKVDIEDPSPGSGEIIIAMAKRIVAYCIRNMQGVPDLRENLGGNEGDLEKYPDVLRHLVGHEEDYPVADDDNEPAPDEDYVIGGTGVAKALACVLKNRGDDSRRQSGEFTREFENGISTPTSRVPSGKAKDMSKHLLAIARKIRDRLQPALVTARASANEDVANMSRLTFLDQTIRGIISRFEDEFPDTRQPSSPAAAAPDRAPPAVPKRGASISSFDGDAAAISDTEELETELRSPSRSRSNSIMSHTSKAFAEEEGRALRVGHKFRRSFLTPEQFNVLNSSESALSGDGEGDGDGDGESSGKLAPEHARLIAGLMDDLAEDDEEMRRRVRERGAVRAFEDDKNDVWRRLRTKDAAYWDSFLESQEKARANMKLEEDLAREANNNNNNNANNNAEAALSKSDLAPLLLKGRPAGDEEAVSD
ncbi:hypothetical protein GGR56DRAFT_667357 [Xylariaceae sp. FL0804]|nr:hypothetical protein GGR56DRAFT_667357 [Xylariaceae sp. FL0804]